MRKIRWEISTGKDDKEYDRFTYECKDDDTWVNTEIPVVEKPDSASSK